MGLVSTLSVICSLHCWCQNGLDGNFGPTVPRNSQDLSLEHGVLQACIGATLATHSHFSMNFGVQVLLYPDGEVGSNEDSQTRQNKFLGNLSCNGHIWLDWTWGMDDLMR